MTDELRTRLTGIIAGDEFPVYEHVAKADLIIEVVEAPLRARIAELEAALKRLHDATVGIERAYYLNREQEAYWNRERSAARAALEKKE